ncbi:unnamed protein product (macronuclear) [Paramecium tetraurelia]|uniref:Uncharacterized protein n=1 Tax=Paramecium tetraurelia TaxID=5888 RepID=A0C2W7_PARTE|nr:uncharacterized protein GSPATT00034612001 [Paramecium tetraurelia]CAK65134.1 unnamed protein product [Paramecium tetraurelia]|eukprot:XP_001432531.1 hypothetical protein (macronuclear) [Paramecium tetraurelia strain d4-2]
MLNQSNPSPKKRMLWTENEDKLLQQLVNKFQNERLGWKKISQSLRKQGYDRNTKACRERFFNHLDNTFNKTELTTQELDKLFELIKIHGNKWTCIAEELNHRTDQDIKNKFYAHIKKVFRRLLKATFQTTESSIMTAKLQPLLISSIFCYENELDQKQILIQNDMKDLFQSLIRKNKSISQGEQIDEETREQVKQITTYLDKENQLYLQNKITRKQNKQIIKTKHIIKKTQFAHNQFQQQQILKKIQMKQPIFVCSQKKLEFPIMDLDTKFQNDFNQFEFDKILENGSLFQPQQIISSVPFQWHQSSYKLELSHQSELSYMAIQSNSYNYSTIWNI